MRVVLLELYRVLPPRPRRLHQRLGGLKPESLRAHHPRRPVPRMLPSRHSLEFPCMERRLPQGAVAARRQPCQCLVGRLLGRSMKSAVRSSSDSMQLPMCGQLRRSAGSPRSIAPRHKPYTKSPRAGKFFEQNLAVPVDLGVGVEPGGVGGFSRSFRPGNPGLFAPRTETAVQESAAGGGRQFLQAALNRSFVKLLLASDGLLKLPLRCGHVRGTFLVSACLSGHLAPIFEAEVQCHLSVPRQEAAHDPLHLGVVLSFASFRLRSNPRLMLRLSSLVRHDPPLEEHRRSGGCLLQIVVDQVRGPLMLLDLQESAGLGGFQLALFATDPGRFSPHHQSTVLQR
mmetsp:Transcript_32374/g.84059  ORF Transcript_32374/g.84059 Transcript_32374/m.84059 type:complete len:342 (+) Transcript_32374:974-1999(+)